MRQLFSTRYITAAKALSIAGCLAILSACGGGTNGSSVDPTLVQLPIAYVKRPVPTIDGTPTGNPISTDFTDPETIHPGAHLVVKMTATVDSPEIDVTDAIIGDTGDVRDPSFSPDGTKLLFALHKAPVNNAVPPITWDIYEYDLSKPLSQVAGSENPRVVISSGASDGEDIMPSFAPGGKIIFSSTRATTTKAVMRDQGLLSSASYPSNVFTPTIEQIQSNRHVFNIFTMDDTGDPSTIQQISFNMSDDFYPTIIRYMPGLQGRVMFLRWERMLGKNQMSLYTMNPDGTDVQILYGEHSHNTGTTPDGTTNNNRIQFIQPRETSDGRVMALAMPFSSTPQATGDNGTFDGGDPVLINVNQYSDYNVSLSSGPTTGSPGQSSLSDRRVSTVPGISKGGRYGSIIPMLDGTNRAFVSYSLCFVNVTNNNITQLKSCNDTSVDLTSPNTIQLPPRYGIFAFDIGGKTILPITSPQAGMYYTDVAAAMNIGDAPSLYQPPQTGNTGYLDIRSVYDMDGVFSKLGSTDPNLTKPSQLADPAQSTADKADNPNLIERPAVFLRIVKGAYLPDPNDTGVKDVKPDDYGVTASRKRLMREIIGYVPVDPDGSVYVKVPANVPLSFDVVDKTGKRIEFNNGKGTFGMEHGSWLSVRPGEVLKCVGCHDPHSNAPHGRAAAQPAGSNPGATQQEYDNQRFTNSIVAPTALGQTMAEARYAFGGEFPVTPSVNMSFVDLWTSMAEIKLHFPANNLPRSAEDASFDYKYSLLPDYVASNDASQLPVSTSCMPFMGAWKSNCRIVINYENNIDPIFTYQNRLVTNMQGTPIMVNGATLDRTCTNCHNINDPTNQAQASAGYLDLSNAATQQNTAWVSNYSQLLQKHDEILADGTNRTDPVTGNNIQTNPSIVPGSAAQSAFFEEFTPGVTATKTVPHCTIDDNDPTGPCVPWLTMHELRLIAEWVDGGAQYYNNPNLVP